MWIQLLIALSVFQLNWAFASNLTIKEEISLSREKRACPRYVRVEPRPYGEWSHWSACSKSCGGGGVQHRRRQCVVPDCQTSESRSCGNVPCALGWAEWCEWGPCRASCGQGERMRLRYCEAGTLRCPGKDYEISRCHANVPCEGWTDWSDWTPCSVSCGLGEQRRERQCNQRDCNGPTTERRQCNQVCHGDWSGWTQWSQCDKPCGGGVTQRHRTCQSTKIRCPGPDLDRRRCNDQPCEHRQTLHDLYCNWTGWSHWSDCAVPNGYRCDLRTHLGIGVRERSRQCVGHPQCKGRCAGGPGSGLNRQSCRLDPRRDPCARP